MESSKHVVFIGGGIFSCATAFFLSKRVGVKITIIESVGIANAASGKAGGFLACWGNSSTQELHNVSFRLHEEVAKELDVKSYRKLKTFAVQRHRNGKTQKGQLSWIGDEHRIMDKDTAQVEPYELTQKLCHASGANVILEKAVSVILKEDKVIGIKLGNNTVIEDFDELVIANGPWSCIAEDWFNVKIPMQGLLSPSLIYHDMLNSPADYAALFCDGDKFSCDLEVYMRHEDVYVCGSFGGADKRITSKQLKNELSENVELVADSKAVDLAKQSFDELIGDKLNFKSKEITVQSCLRPCLTDAVPMVGAIKGFENVYIATGGNCWGITWSLGVGLSLTELIVDGEAKTVDLTPFSPSRFE